MVPQVPLAGEPVTGNGALAALVCAEIGLLAMSMHGVSLPLMAKQASSGREPGILATINLAAVRLEVGIHKFTTWWLVVDI